jgi:hypothetical protein
LFLFGGLDNKWDTGWPVEIWIRVNVSQCPYTSSWNHVWEDVTWRHYQSGRSVCVCSGDV